MGWCTLLLIIVLAVAAPLWLPFVVVVALGILACLIALLFIPFIPLIIVKAKSKDKSNISGTQAESDGNVNIIIKEK